MEPGTYRWDGFEPVIEFEIGSGWRVGHRHAEIFDLFVGGDFPAVGFARFPFAIGADGEVPATDAAAAIAALATNPDVELDDVGPASIGGLSGRTIDLRVTSDNTPIFGTGDEEFHFGPGFVARYHVLDIEGGVLLVAVMAEEGQLEAALPVAQPILDSLRIAG